MYRLTALSSSSTCHPGAAIVNVPYDLLVRGIGNAPTTAWLVLLGVGIITVEYSQAVSYLLRRCLRGEWFSGVDVVDVYPPRRSKRYIPRCTWVKGRLTGQGPEQTHLASRTRYTTPFDRRASWQRPKRSLTDSRVAIATGTLSRCALMHERSKASCSTQAAHGSGS